MSQHWTIRAKAALKAKNLYYKDLAVVLNVTESAVSHYLNGIREPSLLQVKDMAKMLDLSVSELLGDDAVFISDETLIKATNLIKDLPDDKKEIALKLLESLSET